MKQTPTKEKKYIFFFNGVSAPTRGEPSSQGCVGAEMSVKKKKKYFHIGRCPFPVFGHILMSYDSHGCDIVELSIGSLVDDDGVAQRGYQIL